MERVIDINRIRGEAEALAYGAMVANYFISVDVQLIERQPIGRTSSLLHELVPGSPQLTTRRLGKAAVVASLARRVPRGRESRPVAESKDLAQRFVDLLDSSKAEFFEVSDYGTAHPYSGHSFWTFWLLVIDRQIGSCFSLALGASD